MCVGLWGVNKWSSRGNTYCRPPPQSGRWRGMGYEYIICDPTLLNEAYVAQERWTICEKLGKNNLENKRLVCIPLAITVSIIMGEK